MRQRNRLYAVLGAVCATGSLLLVRCGDGVPSPPSGPLLVTRLTLLDAASRQAPVFTDTSSPSDCTLPQLKDTDACTADPFKDHFSPKKSPPTPDSLGEIRVVFNKLPLTFGGDNIEDITYKEGEPPTKIALKHPEALALTCAGPCTAPPPVIKDTRLVGSSLSPDPTQFPYGPALLIAADPADPLAALEPATSYRVTLDGKLGDRDGNKLQQPDPNLLSFTTEPFQVLQVGLGDARNDAWVYGDSAIGAGTSQSPYAVAALANNGVLALVVNAPVDETRFVPSTVTVTVGGSAVPAQLTVLSITGGKCGGGRQRAVYITPASPDGTWDPKAPKGTPLVATVRGGDVWDLSQEVDGKGQHARGKGRNSLSSRGAIVITAQLTGAVVQSGAADYKGLTSDRTPLQCPGGGAADGGVAADGGAPDGGVTDLGPDASGVDGK